MTSVSWEEEQNPSSILQKVASGVSPQQAFIRAPCIAIRDCYHRSRKNGTLEAERWKSRSENSLQQTDLLFIQPLYDQCRRAKNATHLDRRRPSVVRRLYKCDRALLQYIAQNRKYNTSRAVCKCYTNVKILQKQTQYLSDKNLIHRRS